jgi:hypothetical protein
MLPLQREWVRVANRVRNKMQTQWNGFISIRAEAPKRRD